ncbi:MAG: hypothetical protein IJQ05_00260 [Bacteroidaceae bacterium]|nr:hypothetical protein [Bacteroidaceae bacterium]
MSTEEINDNMHKLIIDRLKERHRKMEIIKSYERSKNRVRVFSFVGVLMAACMVGVFFMVGINPASTPADEAVRSSLENVQELIEHGKYEEALSVIERELFVSDSILNDLRSRGNKEDEEIMYEIKAQEIRVEELQKEHAVLKKMLK